MGGRIRIVASGDYLYAIGHDRPETIGFEVFPPMADLLDLSLLPAAPQTDAVPASHLVEADVLLMLGQYLPEGSIAPAAERLTVVARAGVGVDKMDIDALTRHGVMLFNVPDALTEGTAAGALALMLAAARNMVIQDKLTREGRWDDRQYHRGREIYGKTLGVIGPGRIGGELIRICAPFRMRVLAYSPRLTPERAARIGAEAVPLDRLLAESHFVTVCAPLTEETRGMIGAREFERMRKDATFVNVGRGPIVDQAALTAALKERRIASAGIDVFETQPVPKGEPLTLLDNVVLTPHAVCDTYELRRDVLTVIAGELRGFAQGRIPATVVNPPVLASPAFQAKRAALLKRLAS
ncbi:MAG: dehydrogenase [Alphaproteobacteria bacterium]|nr:dehydrogenase [Alphaproteobacteria bacterium]